MFKFKNHFKEIIKLDLSRLDLKDFRKGWLKLYNFVMKRKLNIPMLNLFNIINRLRKIKGPLSLTFLKIMII